MIFASRICSGLEMGSASIRAKTSSEDTRPSISSRPISALEETDQSSFGATSDPTTLIGIPEAEPGV